MEHPRHAGAQQVLGLVIGHDAADHQPDVAQATSTIAALALERSETELRNLELDILTEVRRIVRAVGAAAESVESAEVSRRLEERNYEAEQKRYENGMSTSFQVLRIQEDLNGARSRYVAAVAAYRRLDRFACR